MPRIAVISDIHANLHALHAVMEDVQAELCSSLVCLGDVVGYNAYPAECVDFIRSCNCEVVKGNHDAEVMEARLQNMNELARVAMDWTRSRLNEEQLTWLSRLQYMRMVGAQLPQQAKFTIVHSSLDQPKAWNYIMNANDATGNFRRQFTPLCFHGHTHIPRIFFMPRGEFRAQEDLGLRQQIYDQGFTEFSLVPGCKYFVNVGSVGQPRDNDPRACYAVYDSDAATVKIKRVVYDVQSAMEAVRAVGLPEYLAERLGRGC